MRFQNAATEAHFALMQTDTLAKNLFRLGLTSSCGSILVVMRLAFAESVSDAVEPIWRLNFLAAAICMALSFIVTAATQVPCVLRLLSPQLREAAIVAVMLILTALQFFLDPWYGARILQRDPSRLLAPAQSVCFSDTRLVLVLSILLTASHLALPIRWVCLIPLEVLPGVLYVGFAFVLGGPDGDSGWSTLLLIYGLVVCIVIGRRTIEDHQRQTYCTLIKERKMRAHTEFRLEELEQRSNPARHMSDDSYTSEVRSRPETTTSGLAFEMPDRNTTSACLNRLIDLGRREQWYINNDELKLLPSFLGEGTYGMVIAAEYYGSPVAIKVNKLNAKLANLFQVGLDNLVSMLNEVRILRRLRHPNIVLMHGASLDAEHGDIAIILERVFGKTLDGVFCNHPTKEQDFQPCDQLHAIVDISRALRYLHSRSPPIVHGDLKASNIVAEQRPGMRGFYRIKLLDFGLARALTKHAMPLGGTLLWMAPEVVSNPHRPPHVQADVFSFGRVAFLILTGTTAFADHPTEKILDSIKMECMPLLPWPPSIEPDLEMCKSMVDRCTEFQARLRPSMETVGTFFESTVEDTSGEAKGPGPDGWWLRSQSTGSRGLIGSCQQQQIGDTSKTEWNSTMHNTHLSGGGRFSLGVSTPARPARQRHTIHGLRHLPRATEGDAQFISCPVLPCQPMSMSERPSKRRYGPASSRHTMDKTMLTGPMSHLKASEEMERTFSGSTSE